MKYVFETLDVVKVDELINLGEWLRRFKSVVDCSAPLVEKKGATVSAVVSAHGDGTVSATLNFAHEQVERDYTATITRESVEYFSQDNFNFVCNTFSEFYEQLKELGL